MPQSSFNDGVVTIYRVKNVASPGDLHREELEKKGCLRYRQRTIGVRRHYTALSAQSRVDLLLRVPYTGEVSSLDVAVPVDGQQYRIELIQTIEGEQPPVMDLTLKRLEKDYDISEGT